jgi:hypothetical protein
MSGSRALGIRFPATGLGLFHAWPRGNFDTCLPRLRKSNRNSLFRRSHPVLALAHVLHFLAHVLAGFAGLCFRSTRSRFGSLFRHDFYIPPPPR